MIKRETGITGDFIRLDALLKFAGIVSTGGEAKELIGEEKVFVNGALCTLRQKKLVPGDIVKTGDTEIAVKRRDEK